MSSPAALAEGIEADWRLPLIDAKRGEVFAGLYGPEGPVWEPFAATPEAVAERVREAGAQPLAAGDGSVRFRTALEAAGIGWRRTRRALMWFAPCVCRLALKVPDEPPETVLPDYLRAPDAKPR